MHHVPSPFVSCRPSFRFTGWLSCGWLIFREMWWRCQLRPCFTTSYREWCAQDNRWSRKDFSSGNTIFVFHVKRTALRRNGPCHSAFLTQMPGVFFTQQVKAWKYANYKAVLLLCWLLICYAYFKIKAHLKGLLFGLKIPFFCANRLSLWCKLAGKSMFVGLQKHASCVTNAWWWSSCIVAMWHRMVVLGSRMSKTSPVFHLFHDFVL